MTQEFRSREEAVAAVRERIERELQEIMRQECSLDSLCRALDEFARRYDGNPVVVKVRWPEVRLEFDGASLSW